MINHNKITKKKKKLNTKRNKCTYVFVFIEGYRLTGREKRNVGWRGLKGEVVRKEKGKNKKTQLSIPIFIYRIEIEAKKIIIQQKIS